MEKRLGIHLQPYDVFVNVAGGISIDEPAIDLGVASAVLSSFKEYPLDATTILFGEVGLGGEIRAVVHAEHRLREAEKLGFTRCLLPHRNCASLKKGRSMELHGVQDIGEAFEILFS